MILLIDNYDSFTYNLVQMMETVLMEGNKDGRREKDGHVKVIRNDQADISVIEDLAPVGIVLSPGPGRPADAGICEDLIRGGGGRVPILGVCLGHQAICEVFGAKIVYAKHLMHGKQSRISLDCDCPLFSGLPEQIPAARYHSLVADPVTIPDELAVTARSDSGEIMAVAHREYPIYGLQFHPESILTPDGPKIIRNFIELSLKRQALSTEKGRYHNDSASDS